MVLKRLAFALLVSSMTIHVRAEKAAVTGTVRLSRAEYDHLKDSADAATLAPRKPVLEVPPTIAAATYELSIGDDRSMLSLALEVVVKPPARDARIVLPAVGLLDSFVEKGPAPVGVSGEDGKTALRFTKPGRYHVDIRLLPTESVLGAHRAVDFPVVPAAAARLVVTRAPEGATLTLAAGAGAADAITVGAPRPIPSSGFVKVVAKVGARFEAVAEKPVVIAETIDVVSIERERVLWRSVFHLGISRAPLSELAIEVAPGADRISVDGPGLPELDLTADGHGTIRFAKPVTGDVTASILLERPAPPSSEKLSVVPTRLPAAASNRGFVLVQPAPLREVTAASNAGLARADVSDLPAFARPFTSSGTRAYRVLEPTANLVLTAPLRDVTKPPEALVREASLLTVFGDGRSRLDRKRFVVDTKEPVFVVPLEAGEEVQSLSVDGQPLKLNGDAGELIVVLKPSRSTARTIDVTTKRSADALPKSGEVTVSHGRLPSSASLASWTIVLPETKRYRYVASSGIRQIGWSQDEEPAAAPVERDDRSAAGWLPAGAGGSANLTVQVTDENGQTLPGTTVEVQGPGGLTRTALSDSNGVARLANLPSGSYTIKATISGFKSVERKALLSPGAGVLVNARMGLAAVSAEVTVTGEASIVDVTSTTTGMTVRMNEPPANAKELFKKKSEAQTIPQSRTYSSSLTIAGASSFDNNFLINGVNTDQKQNSAGVRSLPMNVTGHGKRLLLAGPLVGSEPISVTLRVKS